MLNLKLKMLIYPFLHEMKQMGLIKLQKLDLLKQAIVCTST